MSAPYELYGALASPYSLKMRAILRYRRIVHIWRSGEEAFQKSQSAVKVPVIPVLRFPDGAYANESTTLIDTLEERHPERSIVPPDEADAFLAYLIEDFADEWLTKAMFQYRWRREIDQKVMSNWLAFDYFHGGGAEKINAFGAQFAERQIERLAGIVSAPENYDLVEETAEEVMAAIDAHVADGFYIFGDRPSRAEFGLYGQMSQFAVDPTPQALMRDRFPYCYRWIENLHDLSGVDGEWAPGAARNAPLVATLLSQIGEVYLPFLKANAAALATGEEAVRIELRGHSFRQAPFKYQGKCYAELKKRYGALSEHARDTLDPLLSAAGCAAYLAS